MRPFESAVQAASDAEEIPGLVLLATNRSGSLHYARAFGKRSVREGADQSPLTTDSVMWIASCTKMIVSMAAMQCVEQNLLSLDDPVYTILPELKDKPVLTGFRDEDGSPLLVPHRNKLTLRHLLTHSSGLAYDETHPLLLAWHAFHGTKPNRDGTVGGRYNYPLVFEPGEDWIYGPGIDWAGIMVERVNLDGFDLQQYCQENIFSRVGARDIVFSSRMASRPDLSARKVDMSKRDPENPRKVKRSNARLQFNDTGDCLGGLGLFASPISYLKILQGLLTTDENRMLMSTSSVDEFFRTCLSPGAKRGLNRFQKLKEVRDGMGCIPESITKNWGLGGIINEQDVPGGRSAGSMTWSGLPNLNWFVDRKRGVCALYAGQILPPADPKAAELFALFEQGVYDMLTEKPSKL